jgi:plasmid stabilization system protein ParE
VTVRFLVEAEAELDGAVTYYNAQLSGLGAELAAEVRDGLARVEEHPKAWQLLGRRVRRYRLTRFPYGLLYTELQSEIVVLAVMHLHRKPDYWRERLEQKPAR